MLLTDKYGECLNTYHGCHICRDFVKCLAPTPIVYFGHSLSSSADDLLVYADSQVIEYEDAYYIPEYLP